MPFTPFHFGPGAAVHALAPKHISFIAFCVANVLIDIEPLYFMLTGGYPLHRFFHTYIGASLIPVTILLLFVIARQFQRFIPNRHAWKTSGIFPVLSGAAIGSYSHIVLDSVMHQDITPFAPFSNVNPLFKMLSINALHGICLSAGAAGFCLLIIRWLLRQKN